MNENSKAAKPSLMHRLGHFGATVGQNPRRKTTRFALQVGVPVLIFAALAYVLFKQWSSLPDYEWHFSPPWLLLSTVLFLLFSLLVALLWKLIVHFLGGHLRLVPALSIFAKSLLARYVPGNMLMVISRVIMAEREGVSRKASLTSVVYELAITLCAAVAVASYFLVTLPSLEGNPVRWLILIDVPLTLFIFHPKIFRPVSDRVLRKLGREPIPTVLAFRVVLGLLVLYGLLWVFVGIASYAFIRSVYPLPLSDLPAVTASYCVAWSFGVIAFVSPSGLGTRDAAYTLALKTIMPTPVAAAIAIGSRILQTVTELIFAAIAIGLNKARQK